MRGAAEAFERLVPGDIAGLADGSLRYTVFTNDRGGTLDDLIAGRVAEGLFVVANAGRRAADLAHLRQALEPEHPVEELADRALLALQGPRAAEVLGRLCPSSSGLAFMHTMTATIGGRSCRISRCGYTGEDGFEISVARRRCGGAGPPAARGARGGAGRPGRARLAAPRGGPVPVRPRAERRHHAGRGRSRLDDRQAPAPRSNFPGADVILRQLAEGAQRRLVGIRPDGRAPAREGTEISDSGGQPVGMVTSGGFGPTVGGPIALGYVRAAQAAPASPLQLSIRGKPHPAKVVALPFVPHRYQR